MLRSAFLKSLLVLALLFAQQGVVTHGISHVLAEQDQSQPHDQHCELCAAYVQVCSAIGSSHFHFDPGTYSTETHRDTAVAFRALPCAAFAARAPPYSA